MQEADGLCGSDGEHLAGRESSGKEGQKCPRGLLPCPAGDNLQILPPTLRKAERVDTEARVTSDRSELQSWQREGIQVQLRLIYMTLSSGTPPSRLEGGAGDGCTCEKATVSASSSGPVTFSARSIHTWVEQAEGTLGSVLRSPPYPIPPWSSPVQIIPRNSHFIPQGPALGNLAPSHLDGGWGLCFPAPWTLWAT